jgi:energy-coupling factor transporter ATP-binding protein EcfA2
VLIDGRAVALVGPSGAGKSTTAAAFAAAGTPVLTDDVLALRPGDAGAVVAYPAYRMLRLWDASERIVFGTAGQLPLLTPTWDKRALPLGEDFPFHAHPAPLGDVFVLAARSGDERAPYTEPMRPRIACMALVANSYANYLLDDAMRAHELRALEALLRGRRVHRLVPHEDPARLARLVDAVRTTLRDA